MMRIRKPGLFPSAVSGKNRQGHGHSPAPPGVPSDGEPFENSDTIRAFDAYGREMFISKQAWRDKVLIDGLEEARTDPDTLYIWLVTALQDGFAADIVSFAEHLWLIDPVASRGATILGMVYIWKETLRFWDNHLAEARLAQTNEGIETTPAIVMMAVKGPLWTRSGSPFAAHLPAKRAVSPAVAVFGGNVLTTAVAEKSRVRLSDVPGRLSRVAEEPPARRRHRAACRNRHNGAVQRT